MTVSDFQVMRPEHGSPFVLARLWVLYYEGGCLTSFDYDDIYQNVFNMLEHGVVHDLNSVTIVCSENKFPDVFKSCIYKEHERKYTFKKH